MDHDYSDSSDGEIHYCDVRKYNNPDPNEEFTIQKLGSFYRMDLKTTAPTGNYFKIQTDEELLHCLNVLNLLYVHMYWEKRPLDPDMYWVCDLIDSNPEYLKEHCQKSLSSSVSSVFCQMIDAEVAAAAAAAAAAAKRMSKKRRRDQEKLNS
jgi:hypothetical protein